MTTRRGLITGLVSFMAAPAIVRAGSLMSVSSRFLTPQALPWSKEILVAYNTYYTCEGGIPSDTNESLSWRPGSQPAIVWQQGNEYLFK